MKKKEGGGAKGQRMNWRKVRERNQRARLCSASCRFEGGGGLRDCDCPVKAKEAAAWGSVGKIRLDDAGMTAQWIYLNLILVMDVLKRNTVV